MQQLKFFTVIHCEFCPNQWAVYGNTTGEEISVCDFVNEGLARDKGCVHLIERRFPEGNSLFYCENCGGEDGPIFSTLNKAKTHVVTRHIGNTRSRQIETKHITPRQIETKHIAPRKIHLKVLDVSEEEMMRMIRQGGRFWVRYGETWGSHEDENLEDTFYIDWYETEEVFELTVNPTEKVGDNEYTDCSSPRGGLCWKDMGGCSYLYYDDQGIWYRRRSSEHCAQILVLQ